MLNIEIVNLIQRITGLAAFFLITLQIFLSSNRKYIKYHMLNGILAYTFVFIHPVLMVVSNYLFSSNFDPFYVYVDACVMCNGTYEYYVNFGRIAFYSVTIAVIAAKLRNINTWLKNNWRKLHLLNYIAFYAVSIHAYNIGTDFSKTIFIYLFWICQLVVLYTLVLKVRQLLISR